MILHRLASAIRNQNWSQIITEILIVVIGIFLGLQVTDWAEGRAERAEESGYLVSLHQDISQSIVNNERRMNTVLDRWRQAKLISDSLAGCKLADEDKDAFAFGLFAFGKYQPVTMSGTTIEELMSTGKFQIIENKELRGAISTHLAAITDQLSKYDETKAVMLAHLNLIEKNYAHKVTKVDPTFTFPQVTWDSITIDFEKFCKNEEIKNSISQIFKQTIALGKLSQTVLDQQRELKAMLEIEMEKKP